MSSSRFVSLISRTRIPSCDPSKQPTVKSLLGLFLRHSTFSSRRHFATEKASSEIASSETGPQDELLIERLTGEQAGILVLSINRPAARNAISRNFAHLLRETLATETKATDVRVLILRSSSTGIFCAGADLKERMKLKEEEVGPFVSSLRDMVQKLYSFSFPTVAALDGLALGGGLELALACDIRVASRTAKMGLVETKLGIIPGAGGTQLLPRLIGASRAKDLIFAGTTFDGEQAKSLGVVNHTVEQNEKGDAAYRRSVEVAERMLSNGPFALRMAKLAINQGIEMSLSEGWGFEEKCYGQVIGTKDRKEGLLAFNEKRKPKFIGE
ncbi:Methylglutaconyl-CoA hydratase, mitochondrial [Hypsibius exemplaris]|uniref:Methylglutaconyl-CoA hydratase, mitochondrial n=1 Tax=Hypsibius exemplaris TaxID=2072580 RepID=A0A1W0WXE2_HYPEX|nr:Methylglutaconyl-CoA hydratase, mitochondrial [Hypsibius exemplaris]